MAKIGIFDSGSGGLSVYREIHKLLPGEQYVYVSDSAYCPYGGRTREEIEHRATVISEYLIGMGCELIVVACNTATAAAIAFLREKFPSVPFIGMEPAVKPAALATKTGVIGVLATAGTLKASKYLDTRDRFSDGIKVIEHVGQGFVELVENGILEGPEAESTVRESVAPLVESGADFIVLGCTHYPFLRPVIEKVAAELAPDREITVIDPAPAVARQLVNVMTQKNIPSSPEGEEGSIDLYASGDLESLRRIYKLI